MGAFQKFAGTEEGQNVLAKKELLDRLAVSGMGMSKTYQKQEREFIRGKAMWKALSDAERARYQRMAEERKNQHHSFSIESESEEEEQNENRVETEIESLLETPSKRKAVDEQGVAANDKGANKKTRGGQ